MAVRRLAALLSLAALACGGMITAPSQPQLVFQSQIIFGFPTIPIVAAPHKGGVLVTGAVITPKTSYVLAGDVRAPSTRAVVLEITVSDTGQGYQFNTQNYYRADVQALGPGSYDLSVVYIYATPPLRSDVVHRETVLVP
jgi:hypothetical protein